MQPLLTQVVERIDMLYNRDNPSDVTGVPTGFVDLDRMTSGFQPGDLIIIAGRPSMGKTSLALNIGENVALDTGMPVAVFSMEMGAAQLALRMIGSVGRLDQPEHPDADQLIELDLRRQPLRQPLREHLDQRQVCHHEAVALLGIRRRVAYRHAHRPKSQNRTARDSWGRHRRRSL